MNFAFACTSSTAVSGPYWLLESIAYASVTPALRPFRFAFAVVTPAAKVTLVGEKYAKVSFTLTVMSTDPALGLLR